MSTKPSLFAAEMKDGKVTAGGHSIKEDDFIFLEGQLSGQFDCLSGRIYSLIEELGLPDKQERAAKRHARHEIWQRFEDFIACMKMMTNEKYLCDSARGLPPIPGDPDS